MSSRHDKRLNTPVSTANPVSKRETDLLFNPENKNRPFQRSKNRPICGDKNSPILPFEKCPKMGD